MSRVGDSQYHYFKQYEERLTNLKKDWVAKAESRD